MNKTWTKLYILVVTIFLLLVTVGFWHPLPTIVGKVVNIISWIVLCMAFLKGDISKHRMLNYIGSACCMLIVIISIFSSI